MNIIEFYLILYKLLWINTFNEASHEVRRGETESLDSPIWTIIVKNESRTMMSELKSYFLIGTEKSQSRISHPLFFKFLSRENKYYLFYEKISKCALLVELQTVQLFFLSSLDLVSTSLICY